MSEPSTMRIGVAAVQAGVHVQTLRFYERRGLLPRPHRGSGNYRLYTRESVERVRFIRRAQELGFSLAEVAELLALRLDAEATCADLRDRTAEKIADIDRRMGALRAMKRALVRLHAACAGGEAPLSECPIVESLGGDSPESGRAHPKEKEVERP